MWPSPVPPASSARRGSAGRPEEYDENPDSPTRRGVTGRLQAFVFPGPAGKLEGLWKDAEGPRAGSAVFGHPHPLHGGTLRNKVVFRAARCLSRAGYGVLRFNFRGVGLSGGAFDSGRGEAEDFRAALDEVERRDGAPVVAGGFSFGAAAGLRAIDGDSRIRAFIGVGVPLASVPADSLPLPRVPALFVVGSDDVYGPPALLRAWARNVGRIVEIPGADHFLEGRLDELEGIISTFLGELRAAAGE
jgi:alpha/beta superfamily hydrolase